MNERTSDDPENAAVVRAESAGELVRDDRDVALFVGMDGVLIHTDTTTEAAFALIRSKPTSALAMLWWLLLGKSHLKRRIAEEVRIDAQTLPYNHGFIGFLRTEKAAGRRLILATGADAAYGERVAAHLGLFDAVLGSDGTVDLAGSRKLEGIHDLVGGGPFDYAGSRMRDIRVLQHARRAIVVNPEPSLRRTSRKGLKTDRTFDEGRQTYADYLRALHPRRWLMNLLVLLPIPSAAEPTDPAIWLQAIVAGVAFSLFASSLYVFDDLIDLPRRRLLPVEARSPIVAGRVPADRMATAVPLLLLAGVAIATALSGGVAALLGLFLFVWALGAMTAPHAAIAGLLASGLLAGIRVLAGGVAVSALPPLWLIGVGLALGTAVDLMRPRRLGFV